MRRSILLRLAALLAVPVLLAGVGATASAQTANPFIGTQVVFALTTSNKLLSFNQYATKHIQSQVPITGLAANEQMLGIDFRPMNGRLYGVSSASQIYAIDHRTGAATKVGGSFSPRLEPGEVGFDFNPTVDRIRLVTQSGQDLRLHPDTGAVVAVDGRLAYGPADRSDGRQPGVTAVAYTNPDNDAATGTTLYDLDTSADLLVTQDPPNDGRLNTVASLGLDATGLAGFDINQSNEALASIQLYPGAMSSLYSVDLRTGALRWMGVIGGNTEPIRDISIFNNAANPAAMP